MSIFRLNIAFYLLLLTTSLQANDPTDPQQPLPLKNQQHGLVERIYAVEQQTFISKQALLEAVHEHRFVLLGETHDNRRHHDIQQDVLEYLAQQATTTSVAFEMVDDEQAAMLGDLNQYDIDTLIERLTEAGAGWNYEVDYRALFATALDERLPIYAANIEKSKLMALMRNEAAELGPEVQAWLTDMPLTDELEASLRQEIVDSHCGMFTAEVATPMVKVQRARDVAMAQSLTISSADKRVLIAGIGHVREDRGVPFYLSGKVPASSVLTIGMIEVDPEKTTPEQYTARWDQTRFPFDYVWFTAGADREDPCLVFQTGQS